MRKDEVPQYRAKAFLGRKKAVYAVDEHGRYQIVPTAGWEAEEIVLDQALEQYELDEKHALARARRGETSPLEFHMYRRRMDVLLLAQSTGYFRWQVKRHLKPAVFAALSEKKLQRYADALGLTPEELASLPPEA